MNVHSLSPSLLVSLSLAQVLEAAEKSDVLWSKTLLSHVCSLWYVLLPPHLANLWNKMAVLSQAFELLEDMRKNQALPNDEVRIQERRGDRGRRDREREVGRARDRWRREIGSGGGWGGGREREREGGREGKSYTKQCPTNNFT